MYIYIFRYIIVLYVITVSYIERSVRILIIYITVARLVRPYICMIIFSVPFHRFKSHCCMRYVKCLKFSIFIPSIEYQLLVVCPLQTVSHNILWFGIYYGVVPSAVLHNYCFNFQSRIINFKSCVIYFHFYLLM